MSFAGGDNVRPGEEESSGLRLPQFRERRGSGRSRCGALREHPEQAGGDHLHLHVYLYLYLYFAGGDQEGRAEEQS